MRLWHIVGLLAVVLAVKGMTSLSGGWIMGLLGLHDVFSWAAPAWWEGAASMAALGSALTAAQVDLDAAKTDTVRGVGRGIYRGENPPAAALALDHLGAPLAEAYQVEMEPSPHGGGDDHRLGEPPHVEDGLGLFFLHHQIQNMRHQNGDLMIHPAEPKAIILKI